MTREALTPRRMLLPGMETSEFDQLNTKYQAVIRDLVDMAAALGVDASFDAMAQRIADLLNMERELRKLVASLPSQG